MTTPSISRDGSGLMPLTIDIISGSEDLTASIHT